MGTYHGSQTEILLKIKKKNLDSKSWDSNMDRKILQNSWNTLKQWKNRKTQNVCKKLKTNFDPWLVKSRRKSRNIEIYIGSSLALRPCPTLDKTLGFANF